VRELRYLVLRVVPHTPGRRRGRRDGGRERWGLRPRVARRAEPLRTEVVLLAVVVAMVILRVASSRQRGC